MASFAGQFQTQRQIMSSGGHGMHPCALYVETEYYPHLATPQNDSKTFFVCKPLPTNCLLRCASDQ